MAINSGASIVEKGTLDTVMSDSSAISNGAFDAGTKTALTPTDKVPMADLVLDIQFASAPTAGKTVDIYRRDLSIDGTNDNPVPDLNFKSKFVGSIIVDAVATRQYLSLNNVPISDSQEFYLLNSTGVATTGTTVLKAQPKGYNGKA